MPDYLTPEQLAAIQASRQGAQAVANQNPAGFDRWADQHGWSGSPTQPLTPGQAQSAFVQAAQQNVAPIPTAAPPPTMTETIGQKLSDVGAIGGAVANPIGLMTSTLAGESIADRVRRALRSETRDIRSFERDQPTELREMDTPLADVKAGPTLAELATPTRMAAGMGVGGGVGSGSSLGAQIDESRKAQLGAFSKERDAQGREGVGVADRTERTAEMEEEDARKAAEMWQTKADEEKEINAGVDRFFMTNAKMANDIATSKVDSGRLFKTKSVGENIVMGIGAALGGMLAGLQGGQNQFMQHVDRLIDRDVEDQKAAIENKRAGLQARQNMYSQLLQQTGDRRLADMQLRNLQLESIKAQTKARADALKTPEILAQSDKLIAGIEQKQSALQTAMLEHKQQQQMAAAAATAAARAAAEEKAWQRQIKIAELGQKQDELNIKKAEAGLVPGAQNKETRQAVAKLGDQLGSADMTRGRESLDRLLGQIEKTKSGEHIPGFTLTDRAVGGIPGVGAHLRSDQANTNQQDYNALLGVYSNIRTGSGGSDREAEKILKEAEGANTPAERANFIRKMAADLARRENAYRAAAGPDASAQYDANMAAVKGTMPNTVQRKK